MAAAKTVAWFGSCAVLVVLLVSPEARGDNRRLNDGVVANVYTIQRNAGCGGELHVSPELQAAAARHARDIMVHRDLSDDVGSDGSGPQDRASAAGFRGDAVQTVAVNPALAVNNIEILQQRYYDPRDYAIMSDCTRTVIGVWSENSLDRSVVVAVYGRPE